MYNCKLYHRETPFPGLLKKVQSSSQLLADRLRDHIRFPSVFLHFSRGNKVAILTESEDCSPYFSY